MMPDEKKTLNLVEHQFHSTKTYNMESRKNLFMHSPGGENEASGSLANQNTDASKATDVNADGKPQEKGFIGKIKDALRDWSKDDQAQQDFDDTRP